MRSAREVPEKIVIDCFDLWSQVIGGIQTIFLSLFVWAPASTYSFFLPTVHY